MTLNGGGYTFINPNHLNLLTDKDVQAMFTDTTSFLMRVRKPGNVQPYAVLSQLPQYRYVCECDLSLQSFRSEADLGMLAEQLLHKTGQNMSRCGFLRATA